VAYQDLVRRLAEACRFMAKELAEHRLPTAARDQLREIGETSTHVQLTDSVSAVVILAQTRSIVIDMLQLTRMDYLQARELVPTWTELISWSPAGLGMTKTAAGERFGLASALT
jgi:hypothetical protein